MTGAAVFGPGAVVGVAVPAPIDEPLDYLVPDGMTLGLGDLVEVPLGSRRLVGCVWSEGTSGRPPERLKPVARRYDERPLAPAMLRFLGRAADYTLTPPGQMMRLAARVPDLGKPPPREIVYRFAGPAPDRLTPQRQRVIDTLKDAPAGLSGARLREMAEASSAVIRGLVECGTLTAEAVLAEMPYPAFFGQAAGHHLSADQAAVADRLRAHVADRAFRPVLLRGVTGSGKTEVYLEAVAEAVGAGRQALVLLPEVALTPAFLTRVEARFGAAPAAWHHGISPAERRRLWRAAASGDVRLVVGARSALFLPFADLGLIIVDEEHEGSYKQDDGVLYHARDMAVLRAHVEQVAVVLASATPSLESWANAEAGKYERLDLPERFGAARMPRISLVDLRDTGPDRDCWLSGPLIDATRQRLEAGEQTLLFLNRRGYAPLTLCRACGHRFGCPDCDSWLVTHRLRRRLQCHQCGHVAALPRSCPECGRDDRLAECGPGIERIAEEAAQRFPGARLALLSSDLVPGPNEMKARLAEVAAGGADIVIGTQIVAKGHNFPLLTLVGVVDADLGLAGGDLRAAERTFQLLSQVAGRAGRAERRGEALIQTSDPDHPVMRAILSGDAEAFWAAEAESREAAGSPPYGRLAAVIVSGTDEPKVWEIANALGRGRGSLEKAGAMLFGPAPAPISRVRGRARVRLLVKAPKGVALQPALRAWTASVKVPGAVRVAVDVDPQSFL